MRNKEVEWQSRRTSRTRLVGLKSLKTHKKRAINKLQQGQAVMQNTSSCMQNGWNTQGNILEQTAREMVKECGRDEHICK
jgi:hypothetical protein